MSESLVTVVIFASVFTPVIVFAISAVMLSTRARKGTTRQDDYLLAGRDVGQGDFINSSTGYMLQVSTTYYFIYWGYNYGFSNIFYILGWSAGIYLFSKTADRLVDKRYTQTTLPLIISGSASTSSRTLASVATIVSFAGLFYVETFVTTGLITASAGGVASPLEGASTPAWWTVFLILAGTTIAYSLLGGLRKVIANDVWQLSFAFLGLSTVFGLLILQTIGRSLEGGLLMAGLCLAILLTILYTDRDLFDGRLKRNSLLLSILVILVALGAGLLSPRVASSGFDVAGFFTQVGEPWGWFTLLGFTLANLLWQYSDSSVFQRISALSLSDDPRSAAAQLRHTLKRLAIVSPITWSFGILLGMLIRSAAVPNEGGDAYIALIDYLRSRTLAGDPFAIAALGGLIVGLVSIMMSTVDVAIIAATQTYVSDIRQKANFQFRGVLVFGLCLTVAVIGIAVYHVTRHSTVSILAVISGANAAIIGLAPAAVVRILDFRVSNWSISLSILAGLIGSLVGTFGPFSELPANITVVLPIFTAILPAAGVLLIGLVISRIRATRIEHRNG